MVQSEVTTRRPADVMSACYRKCSELYKYSESVFQNKIVEIRIFDRSLKNDINGQS